jgi:hypothetical protein
MRLRARSVVGTLLVLGSLTGCATVVPGTTLVLRNGTTYPCPGGIQLDSHYRCLGEADSPAWAPSAVERIAP